MYWNGSDYWVQCHNITIFVNGKLANCSSFSEDLCSQTTFANIVSINSSSPTYVNYTVKVTRSLKSPFWVIFSIAGGIILLVFILFVHVVLSLFWLKSKTLLFCKCLKLNLDLYLFRKKKV